MKRILSSNQGGEVAMKFKVVKVVGKGSYGTVYKVQRLSDNQIYALKEMDVKAMNQAEREDAANEIRLLASVQHPNVISYNEAFLDGNRLCIIMDFAPDGDLARVIKKFQNERRAMPEELVWKYFIQICNGLLALHRMKILHRDIKPGNIMIMPNDIAKIGDLGIAKLLSKTAAAKTQIGTPHYMPPEIWRNQPYGFSSDSWAMGCLLYEMMTLKVPFEARNIQELRTKVLRGTFPPVPSSYSRELAGLVASCLVDRPEKRPSMEDILNSSAVKARMHLLPVPIEKSAPPPKTAGSVMLDTIKVPRNFQMIKGKLPPAQYKNENMDIVEEGDEESGVVSRLPEIPQLRQQQQQQQAQPMPMAQARVAQQPLPQALHPAGAYPAVPGLGPNGRVDPVLAAMQQKAAMIDNIYNVYNKRPPPAPISVAASEAQVPLGGMAKGPGGGYGAADLRPWYVQAKAPPSAAPSSAISESRAAYGAFYNSPSAAQQAAAHARAIQAAQEQAAALRYGDQLGWQQQQQRYKGHYVPFGGQQQDAGQRGQSPYGGARVGGNWAPPKLQPMQAQPRQQQQQQQQQQQRNAPRNGGGAPSAPMGKPPPWNYGVNAAAKAHSAAASRAGGAPGWRPGGGGGGWGADAGLQGQQVARYPPMQWSPPRMR